MTKAAAPQITVVADNTPTTANNDSLGERIKRLQAQAKSLANEHTNALAKLLTEINAVAASIADGGDAYHVGVRNIARQIAERSEADALNIEALLGRQR